MNRDAVENGSMSIEAVLLTPVLVALLVFGVYLGRIGQLQLRISRAVHDAARAGSVELDPDAAAAAIDQALIDGLGQSQYARCTRDINVTAVGNGSGNIIDQGLVRVKLRCQVDVARLGPLSPPSKTLTRLAYESVDEYRSRRTQP